MMESSLTRDQLLKSIITCKQLLPLRELQKTLKVKGGYLATQTDGKEEYISIKVPGKSRNDILKLFISLVENCEALSQTLDDVEKYLEKEPTTKYQAEDGHSSRHAKESHCMTSSKNQVQDNDTTQQKGRLLKDDREKLRILEEENRILKENQEKSTRKLLLSEIFQRIEKPVKEKQVIETLTTKAADFIDRLAEEMNSKVSSDESNLENISIKNRPLNIAEEFRLMMSNSWLDAKTALDKQETTGKEKDKVELLCNILLESEAKANELYDYIVKKLESLMQRPFQLFPDIQTKSAGKQSIKLGTELSTGLLNSIGDYFRSNADGIDLGYLIEMIYERVLRTYTPAKQPSIKRCLNLNAIKVFQGQCARISWKMILQRPRMRFDISFKDRKWAEQTSLNLTYDSNPKSPGAVILYYKQPSIIHGDQVLVKGEVFVE